MIYRDISFVKIYRYILKIFYYFMQIFHDISQIWYITIYHFMIYRDISRYIAGYIDISRYIVKISPTFQIPSEIFYLNFLFLKLVPQLFYLNFLILKKVPELSYPNFQFLPQLFTSTWGKKHLGSDGENSDISLL